MLTAIPCIDVHSDNLLSKVETQNTSNNHSDSSDHCSPFCTCDCCVSPIFQHDCNLEFKGLSFEQKHISEYLTSYISSIYSSIWQPPKLRTELI